MAPNFQSSFIPKDPVTEQVFQKKKTGFMGMLAISLFISSVIVAVGVYVYKGMLKGDIENLQAELAQAESNIDKETIDQMADFAKKVSIAQSLVGKHQVISNFLGILSSSTVSSVDFDEFDYSGLGTNALEIKLKGKANSYASIALQDNVFSQIPQFKSVSFSDLSLSNSGSVSFSLSILVDPKILVYLGDTSTYSP